MNIQGVFFHWYPPKKLKYGKSRLGESTLTYRVFFSLGLPLKVLCTDKLIQARLGVSGTIYVNVDSPNLDFPYFNFLGEAQWNKTPCMLMPKVNSHAERRKKSLLHYYAKGTFYYWKLIVMSWEMPCAYFTGYPVGCQLTPSWRS